MDISKIDEPQKTRMPPDISELNAQILQSVDVEDTFKIEKPQKLKKYKPIIWEETEFPLSSYQKRYRTKKSMKLKIKMEQAEQLVFYNIKPLTLANALTRFNLTFLKNIHATELYDYGKKECPGINAWLNFNTIVQKMVIKNMKPSYFIAVAEELEKLNNYNTLNTIITALKSAKLNEKMFKKISKLVECDNYFIMRQKIDKLENDFVIVPANLFLKDIEECNKNLESEIASKRFVKQLDFFVNMQDVKFQDRSKLKKKVEHFLLVNLHSCIDIVIDKKTEEISETTRGSYFLFI